MRCCRTSKRVRQEVLIWRKQVTSKETVVPDVNDKAPHLSIVFKNAVLPSPKHCWVHFH